MSPIRHSAVMTGADAQLPWRVEVTPFLGHIDLAGTWGLIGPDGATTLNDILYNSSGAQNDEVAFDLILAVGTWTCSLLYKKDPNRAITTVLLDAASVGTIDQYAAGATANQISSITGITVAETAKHRVSLKAATRHASSSGWFLTLQQMVWRRTA